MPPPLNLTINLYERVHSCPDRMALSIKTQPPSVKGAAEPDFQPLKVIWGYRLVPEVGPGFRVFKEESFCLPGKNEAARVEDVTLNSSCNHKGS